MKHPMPQAVAAAFDVFPLAVRKRLERIRALIYETARNTDGVGPLTETLKWGEPAYLTEASGSGSTIRLGWPKAKPDRAAVYFNCNTTLNAAFRDILPKEFRYEGNRALLLPANGEIDEEALRLCIGMALTYHLKKRR